MYARYRTRSRFYKSPQQLSKAYNVSPNMLRRPKVKPGLLTGIYADQTVDLRERERLEMLESMRHPRERDFYQDHTYHNQWIDRELEKHQKAEIAARYRFFDPRMKLDKWIWYPGDTVEVVSGEGAGQRGAIIAVVRYKNEVLVQNINVQDVVIPASETRPEQIVQREHPISVSRIRHVDPSTNALCHVELVQVRNKETGALEERRISLESGVLLPTPEREDTVEAGDPLKDTPIQDADEPTYDEAKEMPLLVERRLRAMEDHFVQTLKEAYEFHEPLRRANAAALLGFQQGVVRRAADQLAGRVLRGGVAAPQARVPLQGGADVVAEVLAAEQRAVAAATAGTAALPDWWEAMLRPYVEDLQEEQAAAAAEARERAQRAAAEASQDRLAGPGAVDMQALLAEDLELEEEQQEEEAEEPGRDGGR
ncbi:hypothetical protein STCU_05344 [Strigomonas culicis]|uniref:Large subunit ribosomal protein L24 n=1 Tax=Strigomonas culicis TaxID=28005 RepID=S9UGZ3_9TRYP|nr:hypothetical protein STCU_05344 [Strigomonas culicis]|eukprot:EPY28014.1 hypothetical protein STCU_05344 [Strigomonas culicis]